ncbi:MAG: hypothetical protein NT031_01420, partial [Planctomycetota bacterium]|nr:hypothetical protein [Planctomycetota bacterium]
EPISIAIILISLGAAIAAWPYIVDLFTSRIIPWIEERLGETWASPLRALLAWVDGEISPVRALLRRGYTVLKERILGIKAEYVKTSSTTCQQRTTTHIRLDNGKVARQVEETEVNWDDLPKDIRREIMEQQAKKATSRVKAEVDVRQAVVSRVEQRAQEEGMTLEMAS